MAKMKRKYKQKYKSVEDAMREELKALPGIEQKEVKKVIVSKIVKRKKNKEIIKIVKTKTTKYTKEKKGKTINTKLDIGDKRLFNALCSILGESEVKHKFNKLISSGVAKSYKEILNKLYESWGRDVYSHLYNIDEALSDYELSLPDPEGFGLLDKKLQEKIIKEYISNNNYDYFRSENIWTDIENLYLR